MRADEFVWIWLAMVRGAAGTATARPGAPAALVGAPGEGIVTDREGRDARTSLGFHVFQAPTECDDSAGEARHTWNHGLDTLASSDWLAVAGRGARGRSAACSR